MADVGPRWGSSVQANVKLMIEQFSEVLSQAPKLGAVTRNIHYGSDPRQVLDVYQPAELPHGACPVVMFVHGGAFVEGEKDRTSEVYSNVLWYFARHGVLGINVEFRLAPEHRYPAGTLDMADAVAWARREVGAFGGDPERIFLMGHSAGGAHSAHYAYDQRFHPPEGSGLAGLICVSGRVRAEDSAENPNAARVRAYYASPQDMEEGSAVHHVSAQSLPTFVAMAEYENPLIDVHSVDLVSRLTQARRRAPPHLWLREHNHTSIICHFNTAEDALGRQILAFMAAPR